MQGVTCDVLVQEVSGRLYDVLVFAGGWMRPEVTDGDRGEVYGQQLQALRQICLPEVSFLLHSVLHSSGHYKKVSRAWGGGGECSMEWSVCFCPPSVSRLLTS